MDVTIPMSCAICGSEETTGRWHARRPCAYLPVCETCRTGEHFKEKYRIMLEKRAYRFPRPRFAEAVTFCGHGMNFDADCDGCARESGGAAFVDIDNSDTVVPQRFVALETRATFIG